MPDANDRLTLLDFSPARQPREAMWMRLSQPAAPRSTQNETIRNGCSDWAERCRPAADTGRRFNSFSTLRIAAMAAP